MDDPFVQCTFWLMQRSKGKIKNYRRSHPTSCDEERQPLADEPTVIKTIPANARHLFTARLIAGSRPIWETLDFGSPDVTASFLLQRQARAWS